MAYMRLGDLLIAAGAITQEQLEEALTIQKQTKERLGDVLIENNIITERQLIEALQMQLGVDFIDLTAISIPLELAKFVPRAIAKKYNVVPVKLVKDELFVAMSDPLNFVAQEEIKAASHKRVVPMISTRRATERPEQDSELINRTKALDDIKQAENKARQELEKLMDAKVFLEVWVKVRSGWADDEARVRSFGYE